HALRSVGGDDHRRWRGTANGWQQGPHAGTEIEHLTRRSERQAVQELDGGGVQRGSPRLLVRLGGRGVVGGQRLQGTATRRHSQPPAGPSPGWIPSARIVIPFVTVRWVPILARDCPIPLIKRRAMPGPIGSQTLLA